MHAQTLRACDREDEALAAARKAVELDLMAGALANVGRHEEADPLMASLRGGEYGPAGDAAVQAALDAAGLRFPAFIPVWCRSPEPVLAQSAGWPAVLKAMNLQPATEFRI